MYLEDIFWPQTPQPESANMGTNSAAGTKSACAADRRTPRDEVKLLRHAKLPSDAFIIHPFKPTSNRERGKKEKKEFVA